MGKNNAEKEFKPRWNPAVDSLYEYAKGKGFRYGFIYERKILLVKFKYAKTQIDSYFMYGEKGEISDVVFDLRKVHKKYAKNLCNYETFLNQVVRNTNIKLFELSNFIPLNTEERIDAIGYTIACTSAYPFNQYCVWAPSINELIKGLNRLLGLSEKELVPAEVDKVVEKELKKLMLTVAIPSAIISLGGIVLSVIGIAKVIDLKLGLGLGIPIFVLAGIFSFSSVVGFKDGIKNYKQNTDENFYLADYSRF